jgi:hypothetical protein
LILEYSFTLISVALITLTIIIWLIFTCWAYCGSWFKVVRVLCACTILANKAEPKSNEKWWIFLFNDYLISFINQFIISNYKNTGITVSFTEHFCNNAKQNLWITDPFFYYNII